MGGRGTLIGLVRSTHRVHQELKIVVGIPAAIDVITVEHRGCVSVLPLRAGTGNLSQSNQITPENRRSNRAARPLSGSCQIIPRNCRDPHLVAAVFACWGCCFEILMAFGELAPAYHVGHRFFGLVFVWLVGNGQFVSNIINAGV